MPPPPPEDLFVLVGAPRASWSDATHAFLRAPWPVGLSGIGLGWLGLNAVFATAYWLSGGVAHLEPGSWKEAFYFSVQTMGTIGYGSMYPETDLAHAIVVIESVAGLIATAVATGLAFTKFSRTKTRVRFVLHPTIAPYDGVPTLHVRVGNARDNAIVNAQFELWLVRTTRTLEGATFYRSVELPLVRAKMSGLRSAFTLLHPIDARSPLHGADPARLAEDEAEIHVVVTGMDDTTLQPIHATHDWEAAELRWGFRPADILSPLPDGRLLADLGRFDEIVPIEPARP